MAAALLLGACGVASEDAADTTTTEASEETTTTEVASTEPTTTTTEPTTTTEVTTTTEPEAPSIREFDLTTGQYEIECSSANWVTADVQDGEWMTGGDGDPFSADALIEAFDVVYGDADGDGTEDAVVNVLCGPRYPIATATVMVATADGPQKVGQTIEGWAHFAGDRLVIDEPKHLDDDPPGWPSLAERSVMVLEGDEWVVESTEQIAVDDAVLSPY